MIPVEVAAVLVILTISGFRMNHIFNYDMSKIILSFETMI